MLGDNRRQAVLGFVFGALLAVLVFFACLPTIRWIWCERDRSSDVDIEEGRSGDGDGRASSHPEPAQTHYIGPWF